MGNASCRDRVNLAVKGIEEVDEVTLKVSWRFSCIVTAPWKPLLATTGAVLLGRPPR
jgi:hypothetical protein